MEDVLKMVVGMSVITAAWLTVQNAWRRTFDKDGGDDAAWSETSCSSCRRHDRCERLDNP